MAVREPHPIGHVEVEASGAVAAGGAVRGLPRVLALQHQRLKPCATLMKASPVTVLSPISRI